MYILRDVYVWTSLERNTCPFCYIWVMLLSRWIFWVSIFFGWTGKEVKITALFYLLYRKQKSGDFLQKEQINPSDPLKLCINISKNHERSVLGYMLMLYNGGLVYCIGPFPVLLPYPFILECFQDCWNAGCWWWPGFNQWVHWNYNIKHRVIFKETLTNIIFVCFSRVLDWNT